MTRLEKFYKFQLLRFSKLPGSEWKKSNQDKWTKNKKIVDNHGIGIPTGKINNIVVIDLDDYKWDDEHPFIKSFGRDYKKFNTYTQKSGKGGIHLFFKYDSNIYNKNCSNGIDILSDINEEGIYKKKYVVGAGSQIKYSEKDKEKYGLNEDYGTYTILNDCDIVEMPKDLKDWLFKHCYSEENVKRKQVKKQKEVAVSNTANYFKYNLSEKQIRHICERLYEVEPKYYTSYRVNEHWGWLIFTTAMKSLNAFDLWDEYSKKYGTAKYNKSENVEIWNGLDKFNEYNCLNHILKVIDERTLLDYVKYKPTYNPKIKFDKVGEYDKLGKHLKLSNDVDYAIMSGTGTGKTTIVKNQILPNTKFISIVSRRSLAYEQYKVFSESDVDCIWYEHFENDFIPNNENVVIQIDSLMKITHYKKDIGEYSIFLDEYSSLIEHLIRSPTLKKTRSLIFKIFMKLIRDAKQVICVDADLTQYTLGLMDFCGRQLFKINNTFNHNEGVPYEEYFDIDKLISEMKKKDKFLCCVDSAKLGKAIVEQHFNTKKCDEVDSRKIIVNGIEMNKYDVNIYRDEKGYVVYISAENDFLPNLDEWDRVIFSPKIIYGLDSTMKREVFGLFKEHTISPRGMLQQIARCRNIEKLHFIFFEKKFKNPVYIDIKDVEESNKKYDEIAVWEEICDEESCLFYIKLLSIMLYNEDCQSTNKFCHFKLLLDERGFVEQNKKVNKTDKNNLKKITDKQTELEIKNFDIEKPKYQKINEILHIPKDKINEYIDLFVNEGSLNKYLNIKRYLLSSSKILDLMLKERKEFGINKVQSSFYKIELLQEFIKKCKGKSKIETEVKCALSSDEAVKYYDKFNVLFRFRLKNKLDLTKVEDCNNLIYKCMTQLFGYNFQGKHLFNSKRITKDKKKITIHTINKDCISEIEKIIKFQTSVSLNYKI